MDIVEKLRGLPIVVTENGRTGMSRMGGALLSEAADEIERLRGERWNALKELEKEVLASRSEIERLRAAFNSAYTERNRVVALLASVFPSGLKRTSIPDWDEEWNGCIYIDLPTGQASWHFHDSEAHLFSHLPPYEKEWDGHTNEEKYDRVARSALQPKINEARILATNTYEAEGRN